jgi:hypothetical protein
MADFTYLPGDWWQMEDEIHGYWLKVSGQGRHIVQMLVTAVRDQDGNKITHPVPVDADPCERAVLDPEILDLWAIDLFPDGDSDEYPVSLIRPFTDWTEVTA